MLVEFGYKNGWAISNLTDSGSTHGAWGWATLVHQPTPPGQEIAREIFSLSPTWLSKLEEANQSGGEKLTMENLHNDSPGLVI